jgi:hypothetical protein
MPNAGPTTSCDCWIHASSLSCKKVWYERRLVCLSTFMCEGFSCLFVFCIWWGWVWGVGVGFSSLRSCVAVSVRSRVPVLCGVAISDPAGEGQAFASQFALRPFTPGVLGDDGGGKSGTAGAAGASGTGGGVAGQPSAGDCTGLTAGGTLPRDPTVTEFFEALRSIPWVPVVTTRPERWCVVPWPTRPWPRFMAPCECGVEEDLWAISSTRGIVDGSVNSTQLRQMLGWSQPLDALSITTQVAALAEEHSYK